MSPKPLQFLIVLLMLCTLGSSFALDGELAESNQDQHSVIRTELDFHHAQAPVLPYLPVAQRQRCRRLLFTAVPSTFVFSSFSWEGQSVSPFSEVNIPSNKEIRNILSHRGPPSLA